MTFGPAGQAPSLLTVTVDEKALLPILASWDEETGTVTLAYESGTRAFVKAKRSLATRPSSWVASKALP